MPSRSVPRRDRDCRSDDVERALSRMTPPCSSRPVARRTHVADALASPNRSGDIRRPDYESACGTAHRHLTEPTRAHRHKRIVRGASARTWRARSARSARLNWRSEGAAVPPNGGSRARPEEIAGGADHGLHTRGPRWPGRLIRYHRHPLRTSPQLPTAGPARPYRGCRTSARRLGPTV
jgi:hypothetical protein